MVLYMLSTEILHIMIYQDGIIGGDPGAVSRAQGDLLNYAEWKHLCEIAEDNPTIKLLLDKLINTYYIAKEKEQ